MTNSDGFSAGENNFYIKCKDQPWFKNTVNESQRNINSEDIVYTLHVSETPLNITSIMPQGELEAGFEPVSVDLTVKTSGGAEDGIATCYYDFTEYKTDMAFFDTLSTTHRQNFNTFMRGSKLVYVTCVDAAGNEAQGTADFELVIDTTAPMITRAYKEGNYLKLITDEDAECYYDFGRCNFNINNATKMTSALSDSHTAEWIAGKTYHIKCIDIWGSEPSGCSIKLLPSYFG